MGVRILGLNAITSATIIAGTITDYLVAIGNIGATTDDKKMVMDEFITLMANKLASEIQVLTNKSIDQDGAGNDITNIANASIKNAAAIAVNKLAALTVGRVAITNAITGFLEVSAVTAAELAAISGLTATATELNICDEGSDEAVYDGGSSINFRASGVEILSIGEGLFLPETNNIVSFGTDAIEFKDLWLDGVAYIDQLRIDESATIPVMNYAADTGTVENTYLVTLAPALTAYTTGMVLIFQPDAANTGACSVNVNALGAKSIKIDNAGALADPAAGDLDPDIMYMLIYDGTNFQLKNPT